MTPRIFVYALLPLSATTFWACKTADQPARDGGDVAAASFSTSRPASQPASEPASQPASQPSSQPASQPTSRPSSQPASDACCEGEMGSGPLKSKGPDPISSNGEAESGEEVQTRQLTIHITTEPAGAKLFLVGQTDRSELGTAPYTHVATFQVQRKWGEGPDQYFIIESEGAGYELLLPDGSARTIINIQAEKDGKAGDMTMALDAYQVWEHPGEVSQTIVLK